MTGRELAMRIFVYLAFFCAMLFEASLSEAAMPGAKAQINDCPIQNMAY